MANLAGFLQYSYPLTTDGLEPIDVVSNDILASSLQVDGSNNMAATLRMSNNKITEVLAATTDDGAVNRLQMTTADAAITSFANTTFLPKSGGVLTGTISSTSVTNPLTFANSSGTLTCSLSAGNASVTNACTVRMASNSSSTLEFRDIASNVKSALKYTYGSPGSLDMIVNGVTALSTSNTAATFNVPVTLNSPATTGAHAVRYDQMQAADGVVTTNYIAADSVVAANATAALTAEVNARVAAVAAEATTRASQDAALSAAYIAADSVVTNNSVQKTGSIMSGTLTINNIQTFLQATHTASSSLMTMQGGSSTVPNAAHIKMTMGTLGGLEFWDYTGVKMGYMQYDVQNTPDRIVFNVSGVSSLIVQSAAVICSQPLAMSTKQITGLQTGSATDHAVNKGQMDTADGLRLPLTGGTLSGALVANAGLTVAGAGLTVNAPTICNGNLTINGGVLARNMWYPGETIQRKWLSPALADMLTNSSFAAGSSATLITTTLPVTSGNMVIVKGGFEVNANNSADDKYRIVFEFSTQNCTFNNVLGAVSGYRTKYGMYEFMFVPTSSGTKTIKATLHNDSTSDTITVNTANFSWTLEEIQG